MATGRDARHDALAACRQRCWKYDWMIDLDVQKFFDSAPWDLVVRAVQAVTDCPGCCCMSSGGWLRRCSTRTARLSSETRELRKGRRFRRSLANLFMHFAFDLWMAREFPGCPFERYADDAVVHCKSRRQAEYVLARIAARMAEVRLRLHPDKTRIVYCKDSNRRGRARAHLVHLPRVRLPATGGAAQGRQAVHVVLARDQPRGAQGQEHRLRELRIHRHTDLSLDDLARWLNPIIAGWMNYYGRYYRSELEPLLQRVSTYLRRWARKKYKRLRTFKRFKRWWTGLLKREPGLFAHWRWVRAY